MLTVQQKGRLRFAWQCLLLARAEYHKFGNQFMTKGQSIIDSAVDYGRSAKISREEIVLVSKTNKQRRIDLRFSKKPRHSFS